MKDFVQRDRMREQLHKLLLSFSKCKYIIQLQCVTCNVEIIQHEGHGTLDVLSPHDRCKPLFVK